MGNLLLRAPSMTQFWVKVHFPSHPKIPDQRRRPGFELWFCHRLVMWLQANGLISQGCGSPTSKMKIRTTLQDHSSQMKLFTHSPVQEKITRVFNVPGTGFGPWEAGIIRQIPVFCGADIIGWEERYPARKQKDKVISECWELSAKYSYIKACSQG